MCHHRLATITPWLVLNVYYISQQVWYSLWLTFCNDPYVSSKALRLDSYIYGTSATPLRGLLPIASRQLHICEHVLHLYKLSLSYFVGQLCQHWGESRIQLLGVYHPPRFCHPEHVYRKFPRLVAANSLILSCRSCLCTGCLEPVSVISGNPMGSSWGKLAPSRPAKNTSQALNNISLHVMH